MQQLLLFQEEDQEEDAMDKFLKDISIFTGVPLETLKKVEEERQKGRELRKTEAQPRRYHQGTDILCPYALPYSYRPVHECIDDPSWKVLEQIYWAKLHGYKGEL